jgi:hypothetical protein
VSDRRADALRRQTLRRMAVQALMQP